MTNSEFRLLPPTPENLDRIGWEADDKYLESPYGFDSCFLSRSNDDGVWRITRFCDEIQIPTPATMGDVMDLCRLLGIPVKEIT